VLSVPGVGDDFEVRNRLRLARAGVTWNRLRGNRGFDSHPYPMLHRLRWG